MQIFESGQHESKKKCVCSDYDANEIFAAANARHRLLKECGITRECCVRTTMYTVSHVAFQFQCQCWINQGQAMKQMLPKCENRVIDTQDVMRLFMDFSHEADSMRPVSGGGSQIGINPSPSPTTPLIVTPSTQTPVLFSPSPSTNHSSHSSNTGFSFSGSRFSD